MSVLPVRRAPSFVLAVVTATSLLVALALVPAPPARAFGTVNAFGQAAEHERITRRALACGPNESSLEGECFAPRGLHMLAGGTGTTGAVGEPDMGDNFDPEAHCDNADYIKSLLVAYPRTRQVASTQLIACISQLRGHFHTGVDAAGRIVNETLQFDDPGVTSCFGDLTRASKCAALTEFGALLHGVQDFYAHSNYTDVTDASRPIGVDNPPGLGRTGPSPLLDMVAPLITPADVPVHLTTDCFGLICRNRVTHDTINKDHGDIDLPPGTFIGNARTERGRINDNFKRAVEGAIAETDAQWRSFRSRLNSEYGQRRGTVIACVIAHDLPQECLEDAPLRYGLLRKLPDGTYRSYGTWVEEWSVIMRNNQNSVMHRVWNEVRAENPDNPDTGVSADIVLYVVDEDPEQALRVLNYSAQGDMASLFGWYSRRNVDAGGGPTYGIYPIGGIRCEEIGVSPASTAWPGRAPRQVVKTLGMRCTQDPYVRR